MAVQLIFRDPPARRGGERRKWGEHREIAAALRAVPGVWSPIGTYPSSGQASSMAYHIRHGKLAAYRPAGSFEARSCTEDAGHLVYVRYVGEQEQADE